MKKLSVAGFAAVLLLCARAVQAAPTCMPTIEGPIEASAASPIYLPPSNPYAGPTPPAGTMEEEFFVSCDVSGGHYKTVIHVTLPADPAKQSGIVIAEPWHAQDFWTIYDKARNYYTRNGHVSIAIVASNFVLSSFLKKGNPERYASLTLPGPATRGGGRAAGRGQASILAPDQTQNEVLGQVGALIKSGGVPGVKARKVILGGMSATGGVVRTYILYEHATADAKSVYDGYFPEQAAGQITPMQDLDVPVVEIQGERELLGEMRQGNIVRYMRADGPLYRLYEVAGAPHIGTRIATRLPGDSIPTNRIEPGIPECTGHAWSDYPTDMLFNAALDHLVQWVDKGQAPIHAPRIQMVPNAREVARDKFGNALGGWRSSYLDVPVNTYHATWGTYITLPSGPSDPKAATCQLIGWIDPLPPATLKKLYPTHAAYVAKVKADTASLVKRGYLLKEDADMLNQEAQKAPIPN